MTKKELEAEIARLRQFEGFAWQVAEMCRPGGGTDGNYIPVPVAAECLDGILKELKDELALVAKAKAQRDLVIRRFHHVLEVFDSLDVQLEQHGVGRCVRVKG